MVGVDHQEELQLQQRAAEAENQTIQVAAIAHHEVSQAQHEAGLAKAAVQQASTEAALAVANANARVDQTLTEGRAAVAAARGEAEEVRAAAQAAVNQRDAVIQQQEAQHSAVRARIAEIEAESNRLREQAERERAWLIAAFNAESRGEGDNPLIPSMQAKFNAACRPPRPERFYTGTPPRNRSLDRSSSFQSPKSAPSPQQDRTPSQRSRQSADDWPIGADASLLHAIETRQQSLENNVSKALGTIVERLEALTVHTNSRSTRRGTGTSPSRARRQEGREAEGSTPAATQAAEGPTPVAKHASTSAGVQPTSPPG